MDKQFLVVFGVIILVLGGIFAFTNKSDSTDTGSNQNSQVTASSHIFNEGDKPVTLIEYGDFECPACASYYPIIKQVKEELKDSLQFQFRNFPLDNIHPNARAAHRAAEAAAKQGKFWEMHDKLYETQTSWNAQSGTNATQAIKIFEGYASLLGLKLEQFKTDFASQATNDIINADLSEGKKVGVDSTPTFILNGKKIDQNPRDAEAFKKLITDAITEQAKKSTNSNQ